LKTLKLEDFKKDLISEFAKALGEEKDRIWLKTSPEGYYNHTLKKAIIVIAVYYYDEKEGFDNLVEALEKIFKKYKPETGIDIHLVGERFYHSGFSAK